MRKFAWFLSTILLFATVVAQGPPPQDHLRDNTPKVHALTNCTLVPKAGQKIENATLIVRDGKVEAAGKGLAVPADALVHDLKGLWVLPGLIDPWSDYGLEKSAEGAAMRFGQSPQYETNRSGPWSWNQAVKPDFSAAESLKDDEKAAEGLRKAGFTSLLVVPQDGIFRGSSALISLGNKGIRENIYQADINQCLSFDKGSSTQNYPSSLMGAIALIRQTFIDADWYKSTGPDDKKTDLGLEVLYDAMLTNRNWYFEGKDYLDLLRAARIAEEFKFTLNYLSQGDDYLRLDEVKKALGKGNLILTLDFPEAFDIKNVADGREIPLSQLRHWERAPQNPAMVKAAGIPFGFTASGLKKPDLIWKQVRKAIDNGLSEADALHALTAGAAEVIGWQGKLGTLEAGMYANFIVCDKNPLAAEADILETWVNGNRFINLSYPEVDPRGIYELNLNDQNARFTLAGKLSQPKLQQLILGKDTLKGSASLEQGGLILSFGNKEKGYYRLNGVITDEKIEGYGVSPAGSRFNFSAKKTGAAPEKGPKEEKKEKGDLVSRLTFPNLAYGWEKLPEGGDFVVTGATVWTNTSAGIMQEADVWVKDGKVFKVGRDLNVPAKVRRVDGRGKHLTPGIIDEHSHIAVSRGVNEGTHNVSAEVRIGDVVNSDDINIFRQLSGGVTTSQLLHGSANPIGGQSAIIKLRWGSTPEQMKFAEAPGFIKFALGENVKQANWGDKFKSRYPQTRLGVEQVMRDAFQAAKDKERLAQAGDAQAKRRDLQLEALQEIMKGSRYITCHSYVQSELTMLMRLGEQMGFKVNTFTHVLEGFKIPEKIKAHGASASTFADWWAYKYEVIDAIPYNAAIMAKYGINTCINSDDAEMGRRLNQEAGKAVKYGGLSEEEALKLVTLNPAKALHLDQYVGSVAEGKQADLVLWSDHPLSVYAVAEKTFIDGIELFSRDRLESEKALIEAERTALINKMMANEGSDKKPFGGANGPRMYHCDTLESEFDHE